MIEKDGLAGTRHGCKRRAKDVFGCKKGLEVPIVDACNDSEESFTDAWFKPWA